MSNIKETKTELLDTIAGKNREIEELNQIINQRDSEICFHNRQNMEMDKALLKLDGKIKRLSAVLERKDIIEVILVDTIKADGGVIQVGED